ncbi:thiolase family protein [Streptomyces sp. NBRC 109706]|uniref:thiolase family protein n=1 Tax=Streptomyces sp. NBRC 109706 TaxID=1550035 RepID=UPI000782E678|nr:thiolase family protein [Streptomyces sp. NBRC 109706]
MSQRDQDIYVTAVGMAPFGKHRDRDFESLGREAVTRALADGGLGREDIDEAFCGTGYGGPMAGQRVLGRLGLTGIPVSNMENACSSGATALRDAIAAIRSGRSETVLVMGVDHLTRFGGGTLPLETTDPEVRAGMVMPGVYAMRANRYLYETGTDVSALARVSVKSRHNGARNPYAHFRKESTVDEVLAARPIADPFTLPMCSPVSDGAAALVVMSGTARDRHGASGPRIDASVLLSGQFETGFRDMAHSDLARRTAEAAYEQAGVGPEDLDLVELHDAFSSAELMYYESFGLCGPGEAAELLERGETALDGRIPVNPSGGLLSRGHPVGATGVAQICEAVWQLRGEAGDRQVRAPRVAMTHCSGGGISGFDHGASCVHILTKP